MSCGLESTPNFSFAFCGPFARKGRGVGDISLFVEQRNAALVGAALGGKEVGRLWERGLILRTADSAGASGGGELGRVRGRQYGQLKRLLFTILLLVPPTA